MLLYTTMLYIQTFVTHENMMSFVRTYITYDNV